MKQLSIVVIMFIAGLAVSTVLGDLIDIAGNCADRVSCAWLISKASRAAAGGNYLQARKDYEKAIEKINPSNKSLLAKTKNNLAICIFAMADGGKDPASKAKASAESILIFSQSLELFKELGDLERIKEVEKNIEEAAKTAKSAAAA
ncbi:MAG: hypothetical protein LBQ47_04600 [Endomicrobium sp.]|jgi:tetratricopeptide (TPR) repeat protein|nr:hypothetical protein [Endomicrobium sp.]